MARHESKTLPLSFSGWDEAGDFMEIQLYDVIFNEAFGPFEAGQKVKCLVVSELRGYIQAFGDNGEGSPRVSVKFVSV